MSDAALFRALADPTRLRILCLLRRGELCVGDLMAVLGVPQAKTSRPTFPARGAYKADAQKTSYVQLGFLAGLPAAGANGARDCFEPGEATASLTLSMRSRVIS